MEPSAKGEQPPDAGQPATDEGASVEARAQSQTSDDISPKDHLVNDAIGKALQAHYRALTESPLPDRFRVLLAQLEAKDSQDDR